MKQYLLFAYDDFYPLGGFNDFVESFEYYDEIAPYIRSRYKPYSNDWYQIINIEAGFVEVFETGDIFKE